MRVDNLRWHPIRLGIARELPNRWRILRGGRPVGVVCRLTQSQREASQDPTAAWVSLVGKPVIPNDLALDYASRSSHPSFLSAALRVTRLKGVWVPSRGVQDYGTARMLRVEVSGRWFTVVDDGKTRYVYEDFTLDGERDDMGQLVLRRVLSEAARVLGAPDDLGDDGLPQRGTFQPSSFRKGDDSAG